MPNRKDLNLCLTLEESLVLFFRPTTGHLALQLSRCGIFLVPPGFQGLLGVLEDGGLADALNSGLKSSDGVLSGNAAGAQLARACRLRGFLRNQLLSERRFLFAMLGRGGVVAARFKDALRLQQALVAVASLGDLALGVPLRVFGRLHVLI